MATLKTPESPRHMQNPFFNSSPTDPSLPQISSPQALSEITTSLQRILRNSPPLPAYEAKECRGFHMGPTGTAFLLLWLEKTVPGLRIYGDGEEVVVQVSVTTAQSEKSVHGIPQIIGSGGQEQTKQQVRTPLEICLSYLSGTRPPRRVDSSQCGTIHELLTRIALYYAATGDEKYLQEFLAYIPVICEPGGSCEWLFGRAGTLYLLRLMRDFPNTTETCPDRVRANQAIQEAIEDVIDAIVKEGPPWVWKEKEYLGASHGNIGIITQIALSTSRPTILTSLHKPLKRNFSYQLETGNWPAYVLSEKFPILKDATIQFCHGAAGFVICYDALTSATKLDDTGRKIDLLHEMGFEINTSSRSSLETAIRRARGLIWEQGMLTKEPNLCHGTTGTALALEERWKKNVFLASTTVDAVRKGLEMREEDVAKYRQDVEDEGKEFTEEEKVVIGLGFRGLGKSSHPWSLHWGEGGRVWGFLGLYLDREIGLIGFSDV